MNEELALKIAKEIADQFTIGFCDARMVDDFAKIISKGIGKPEHPTDLLIRKYTTLLEELIANDGAELKKLKAFDFETYSKLKKEFTEVVK